MISSSDNQLIHRSTHYKKCGIYGILNTMTGKMYVGQGLNVYERKHAHIYSLSTGNHFNAHLQSAFHLHGVGAFEFFCIEVIAPEFLDERERHWIAHYRSNEKDFGYNMNEGGQKNKRHSEETRKKMSEANRRWVRTPEMRANISRALKQSDAVKAAAQARKGIKLGKVHTKEAREEMSRTRTGRKMPPRTSVQRQRYSDATKKSMANRPDRREHMSLVGKSGKGRVMPPEQRHKISVALSGIKKGCSPELRNRLKHQSDALRGKPLSLEHRKKIAAAQRLAWAARLSRKEAA